MNKLSDPTLTSQRERAKFHRSFIRIGLWASVATMLMLIGVGLWSYQKTNQLVREAQEQSANTFAKGLADALEGQLIIRDFAQIELQLTQAMNSEHIRSISVADSSGTVLSEVTRESPSGKISVVFNDAGTRLADLKTTTIRQGDILQITKPIGHLLNVGWIMLQVMMPRDTALLQGIHKQLLIIISLGAALMVGIFTMGLRRTYSQVKNTQDKIEELNDSLHSVAFYDPLTRLPNRPLLRDRLNQALALASRNHNIVAVCYVDLDGFKEINDEYGHDAGDTVLIEVAKRMNLTVRQHDTVARIGGDEFVVVLNDLQNGDDYQKLIDRILVEILQPVDIGHHMVCVGASIGISLSQHSGFDPSTLVTLADKAMYQAKAKGKNQWCIHNHADSNEEITAK